MTNGSFSQTTLISGAANPVITSGGGTVEGGNLGYNLNATGWTATGGLTMLFGPTGATPVTTGPNQVSGTYADSPGVQGRYGNFELYGPGNATPSDNGLTLSPDGGNFIGMDGDHEYNDGPIEQTINGLTPGQFYAVTYDYAFSEQTQHTGTTTDNITIGFGSESYVTPTYGVDYDTPGLATGDFSGWSTATVVFTADSTSDVLSFFADGTPAGQPPFTLLDGISLYAVTPEVDSTSAALPVMVVAGCLFMAADRRRKCAVSERNDSVA